MLHRALAPLALLALAAAARGEVWEDPDLAEAVAAAKLVVLARAPAEGSRGQAEVEFTVEQVLKGEGAPERLKVGGLHDPTRGDGPEFEPDERVYLMLREDERGGWRVPTPTLGRFPVRGDEVRFATLRDTYLRLTLTRADFEAWLGLLLGRSDPAWLEGLRRHLRQVDPALPGAPRARLFLALEVAARQGLSAEDQDAAARLLDPALPFQLRVSACRALAACPAPAAEQRLLQAAGQDPEPAVRTAALRALGTRRAPSPELYAALQRLYPQAPLETVRFSSPNDPRLNTWPAPRAALVAALGELGPAPVKPFLLNELGRDLPEEVFEAALAAVLRLKGDPALPGELMARFHSEEGLGPAYNTRLCEALVELTGERAPGDDPERWRAWWAERQGR